MLWLDVNIAAYISSTQAINSTARARSTLSSTAAYATAAAVPLLGKGEWLYCDGI